MGDPGLPLQLVGIDMPATVRRLREGGVGRMSANDEEIWEAKS
jgi:hypothetical protein